MVIIVSLTLYVLYSKAKRYALEYVYAYSCNITVVNYENKDIVNPAFTVIEIDCPKNTSTQICKLVKYEIFGSPYVNETFYDNVKSICFNFHKIPAMGRISVEVLFEVHVRIPKTVDIKVNPKYETCNNSLWCITSNVRSIAKLLKSDNDYDTLLNFIRWIDSGISYGGKLIPRKPPEVLKDKQGDCDEQSLLLGAFCRSVGIPAVLGVGMVYYEKLNASRSICNGKIVVKYYNMVWHAWLFAYVRGRWMPVDMTYYDESLPYPKSHIEGAAYWMPTLIFVGTYSKYDYIEGLKGILKKVNETNIRILISEELQLSAKRIITVRESLWNVCRRYATKCVRIILANYKIVLVLAVVATIILIYLKGLRRLEGYERSKPYTKSHKGEKEC